MRSPRNMDVSRFRCGAARSPTIRRAAAAITAAGAIAYGNSLSGVFVFDDHSAITGNPTIVSLWPPWKALSPPTGGSLTVEGRPILNLSLAINHAIGGLDPVGYHLFNLLVHLAAGLTLFGLVGRTLRTPTLAGRFGHRATALAFFTALIWTVHPLQTESVTYVIQRAESLMGLFYLLTLYGYARGGDGGPAAGRWYSLSVASCLLGMGTKEVMATAPLAVLLYDRAYLSGSIREAARRRGPILAALFATSLWLGWLVAEGGGNRSGIIGFGVGVSWPGYLLGQAVALLHYLRLCIWPCPLVFEYGVLEVASLRDVLPQVAMASLVVISAAFAAIFRPKAGFPCFVFLATLAPTSLLPSTTQMIVEHRMYLALSSVVVLAVVGAYALATMRPRGSLPSETTIGGARAATGAILGTVVAIVFVAMTRERNEDYRSELRLWQDTVDKRPGNFLAHHFLAASLEEAGNAPRAREHYLRALQIEPGFYRSHAAMGRMLAADRLVPEAEAHLRKAVELAPDYGEARFVLGALLAQQGRPAEALVHMEMALTDYADNVVLRYNYAHALHAAGRVEESILHYEIAVAIDPSFWEARFNLANTLATLGRGAEALPHFDAVVGLAPAHVAARNNYANTLVRLARHDEALAQYRAAVALAPERGDIHHNLGNVLLELGRREEALASYETAMRLNPGSAVTRRVLESLRAQDAR